MPTSAEPAASESRVLVESPLRSLARIGLWLLAVAGSAIFVYILDPNDWFTRESGRAFLGYAAMFVLPVVAVPIAAGIAVSALRRRKPYRAQVADPSFDALRTQRDRAAAIGGYRVFYVAGFVMAGLFVAELFFTIFPVHALGWLIGDSVPTSGVRLILLAFLSLAAFNSALPARRATRSLQRAKGANW